MSKGTNQPPGIESLPRYFYTLLLLGAGMFGLFLVLMFQQWQAISEQEKRLSFYHLPSISVLYQLQHELEKLETFSLFASFSPHMSSHKHVAGADTLDDHKYMVNHLFERIRQLHQQFVWKQGNTAFIRLEERLHAFLVPLENAVDSKESRLDRFREFLNLAVVSTKQLRRLHERAAIKLTDSLDVIYAQVAWKLLLPGIFMLLVWSGLMVRTFSITRKAITQQKNTEREIIENQSLLQNILDTIPVRVFWKDRDSRYLGCNLLFARDAGVDSVHDMVGRLDSEMAWSEQADLYRRDDKMVMETRQPKLCYEEPLTDREGNRRILETSKVPLLSQDGDVIGVLGSYTDITQRKIQEEVIRRSQKMEAVGQLAGGIAHDFNNQLNVIVGYLDFLKDYLQGDHVARPWVDKALQSTERCVHLTRRLLDFARCGSEDVERVNLNTLVVGLSELIQRTLTPEIELKLQLEESLWPVQINPSMAEDALLNLVLNARDAMTAGGRLIVETSNVALGSTNADIYPQLVPGDYVVLSISDTGMGMSEEIRQQIFTPFFTTKAVGKGTGLGLAMVYSFIQQCDGDIHVYSEPGHGTTFRLYFPRMEGTGSKRSFPEGEFVPLPDGSGTILVVDDEPDLLKLAIGYLQSLGYQTLEAGNAAQALEVLRNHAEIELLFTDVVMPGGVDGYQLAQKAVAIRPDIKILLTSGHAGKVLTTDSLVQFSTKLLLKPYTKLQLAKRIAAALR